MTNKHTQGTWEIIIPINSPKTIFVKAQKELLYISERTAEAEANAKLIAASPIMLEALIKVKDMMEMARKYMPKSIKNSDRFDFENAVATIGSAIDKATK